MPNLLTTNTTDAPLPGSALDADRMPGHWLLARLGKRVLRPGGRELTEQVLAGLDIGSGDDVVELAPGLGATTRLVLDRRPASYTGVDRDPDAVGRVGGMLDGPNRSVITASATDTGLDDDSADVMFGEAYLTMQPDSLKEKVAGEVARVLRPGGRFALHEVAFAPDDIDDAQRAEVSKALSGSIKVNVTPLTLAGWDDLLARHGLEVVSRFQAPLHLLEPKRLVADEGLAGALRFAFNVLRDSHARKRVLAMRRAMGSNSANLQAYGLVAVRKGDAG